MKGSFWRLPLRITWPLRIASVSPGPATTRLMKFWSDLSEVGREHAWSEPEPGGAAQVLELGAGGRVEDEDLADLRVASEVDPEPVDEHALADGQRRLHRLRRDPVGLDQEGLDSRAPGRAPRPR